MKKEKCLGCYEYLNKELPGNYHTACSKKLFGTEIPPEIDFGLNDLEDLAIKSLSETSRLNRCSAKNFNSTYRKKKMIQLIGS
jgi:serine/threonine-protein kinase HipA